MDVGGRACEPGRHGELAEGEARALAEHAQDVSGVGDQSVGTGRCGLHRITLAHCAKADNGNDVPYRPEVPIARFDFGGYLRVDNGKLAEIWLIWDNMTILGQLGFLPAP
jgi:hypothetical protein